MIIHIYYNSIYVKECYRITSRYSSGDKLSQFDYVSYFSDYHIVSIYEVKYILRILCL